jgi:hypothetical protein
MTVGSIVARPGMKAMPHGIGSASRMNGATAT